jgi:putative flippase GtrA
MVYFDNTKRIAKIFFIFTLLSGFGWLCDFLTFSLLIKLFDVKIFTANFLSSYVGVTLVWFVSLNTVFKHSGKGSSTFLLVYWCFQFVSILAYSQLLHMVAIIIPGMIQFAQVASNPEIAAKIIITPFNLVTNFIFMKFLTRFMRKE